MNYTPTSAPCTALGLLRVHIQANGSLRLGPSPQPLIRTGQFRPLVPHELPPAAQEGQRDSTHLGASEATWCIHNLDEVQPQL